MPTTVTEYASAGVLYASALIGNYQTLAVKVDVSALTNTQVDANGYLKPNVPLNLDGLALAGLQPVPQVETATVSGAITATGTVLVSITSNLLNKVIPVTVADQDINTAVATKIRAALTNDADVIAYYTVGGSAATVSLTAKTATVNDATLNIATDNGTATGLTPAPTSANQTAGVGGTSSEVPCVTVEAVKVATNNSTGLATAADPLVACAVSGTLNRDVMEDVLGRALTAPEIAALNGPNSKLVLSLT